ncbi:hypothetical protein [Nitrosomonas communis]|uniref:hypothetical protein n=1 Tax=Nitrosomonas communis TaxID=44574 RepID=UPI0026F351D3|nr:hypothetical protein [Nitrosomonas communis]
MTSPNLENLVKTGYLKREEVDAKEFEGLVRSGRVRLTDAHNSLLSIESRFDLAYNAAHALALAALRWHGYRSDKRYIIFQCIPHTLGLGPEVWRVLILCHDRRNLAEYEGDFEIDEQLVADLQLAADKLLRKIETLGPLK